MDKYADQALGFTFDLPISENAPKAARLEVEKFSDMMDVDILNDVKLLISELVTNSFKYSAPPADAHITVHLNIEPTVIRCEVIDPGPGFSPAARDIALAEPGGWGLSLLDRLSARWGLVQGRGMKVWFELDTIGRVPLLR
ncbi:MAG: ATP-binding protein [Actinobacteria bacterium]|nr:ATP-binding protein [Actinomycetota bacterium]